MMPSPPNFTNDMRDDARRHFRRNGFVHFNGCYVPEHMTYDANDPSRRLSAAEIQERLVNSRKTKPN